MSIPQESGLVGSLEVSHSQLYVLSVVMFTTLKYIVVEFKSMCLCSVGGWPLRMDFLHLKLKVQYTVKLVSRCTTGPALDQMKQDFSPKSRNNDLHRLQ